MTTNHNLIPKSIFDEDFNELNVGWSSASNINRLYNLDKGTVYVPKDGDLKYIGLIRRTRLELLIVDDPKAEFIKHLQTYIPEFMPQQAGDTIVGSGTSIHKDVIIEPNVIIGHNCSIGYDGFGYYNGKHIPHRGRVIIKSGARIGSNVCIDRATIGETVIGEDVKIDNLVHIAHGVKIGSGSHIIAGAVICGSVILSKNI